MLPGALGLQGLLLGKQAELLAPELLQAFMFALGQAPVVQLPVQPGQLLGKLGFAAQLLLQGIQRRAGRILFLFRALGTLLQRRQFVTALAQAGAQLHELLQAWPVGVPAGAEWLQGRAGLQLVGQFVQLRGGVLVLVDKLPEAGCACRDGACGLVAFLAQLRQVGVQMAQAFFFAAGHGQCGFGSKACLLCDLELHPSLLVQPFEFVLALLQGVMSSLLTGQGGVDLRQQAR